MDLNLPKRLAKVEVFLKEILASRQAVFSSSTKFCSQGWIVISPSAITNAETDERTIPLDAHGVAASSTASKGSH